MSCSSCSLALILSSIILSGCTASDPTEAKDSAPAPATESEARSPVLHKPGDVAIPPETRRKWVDDVRNTVHIGNREGIKDSLAPLRNHFGARAAYDAFEQAGIYTHDDPELRKWAAGMIDGLVSKEDPGSEEVAVTAIIRFTKDPDPAVRRSALSELSTRARASTQSARRAAEAAVELFGHSDAETVDDALGLVVAISGTTKGALAAPADRTDPFENTSLVPDLLDLVEHEESGVSSTAQRVCGSVARVDLARGVQLIEALHSQLTAGAPVQTVARLRALSMVTNALTAVAQSARYKRDLEPSISEQLERLRGRCEQLQPQIEELAASGDRQIASAASTTAGYLKSYLKYSELRGE